MWEGSRVNRDNLLFSLVGLVLGFVLAYPVFEAMSTRQPALRQPGQQASGAGSAGAPAGAAGGGGAFAPEVRQLQERLNADPNDIEALRGLIRMNLDINNQPRAMELMERYVELVPADSEAVLFLADLRFSNRQYGKARDGYEHYLELEPPTAKVLTDLGASYRYMQQPEKALEAVVQAEQLDPTYWPALYYQVVVHGFDLGNPELAGQILTRLRAMQPDNQDVKNLVQEFENLQAGAT